MSERKVVIVGAGMAGLSSAMLLAHQGGGQARLGQLGEHPARQIAQRFDQLIPPGGVGVGGG